MIGLKNDITKIILQKFSLVLFAVGVVGWLFLSKDLANVYGQEGPTCTDNDGGLDYYTASGAEGVGPNGWPYVKYDTCLDDNSLKEIICSGTTAMGSGYTCEDGCFEGACINYSPVCTDNDGDTYAIEGGLCGDIDCDDSNASISPGEGEVCENGVDDNCDGLTDSEDPICLVCTDSDNDGYAVEGEACGEVDCDDSNNQVNPGASEVCDNGIDDNCNGQVDTEEPVCSGLSNIVVVGWDGTQREHLMQCYNEELPECVGGLPNLASLSGGNIIDITSTSGASETKSGWAQIFTGYKADVTGVYNNGIYQPIPEGYTVFEKVESFFGDENITTMFISGKGVHTGAACVGEETTKNGLPFIENQGQPWCLTRPHLDYYENDLRQNVNVGTRALELLESHANDHFFALFLFRDPDVTGHIASENSVNYSNAIKDDDYWLGEIMDKIDELGISSNTLVYVTTDHGFDESEDVAMNSRHGNSPYQFLATNDPFVIRGGDRMDLAPTWLERLGVTSTTTPEVDGISLYSYPTWSCVPEGEAFVDYASAPACCIDLGLLSMIRQVGNICLDPTGDSTMDNTGYCTDCGNGTCDVNENMCNCPMDCPY